MWKFLKFDQKQKWVNGDDKKRRPQFHSREEREAYPRAPGLASRALLSIARTNPRLSRYHDIIHLPPPPPPPRQFCESITSIAFNFSSVPQSFQEESENNTKAKFWEVNRMYYGQCERSESTFFSFLNRYIKWPKNVLAFNAKWTYYCPTDFIYIALIGNTTNKAFSQWNLRALPLVTHHVKSESVVNIFALQQRIFV